MDAVAFAQMLELTEKLNRGQITQATFDAMSSLVMRMSANPAPAIVNAAPIAQGAAETVPLLLTENVHYVQPELATTPARAQEERPALRCVSISQSVINSHFVARRGSDAPTFHRDDGNLAALATQATPDDATTTTPRSDAAEASSSSKRGATTPPFVSPYVLSRFLAERAVHEIVFSQQWVASNTDRGHEVSEEAFRRRTQCGCPSFRRGGSVRLAQSRFRWRPPTLLPTATK